jgi:cysteine-rich repeat protein
VPDFGGVGTVGNSDVPGGSDARDVTGFDGGRADVTGRPDIGGGDSSGPDRAQCGNGRVELGEVCDDGNNFPSDGCSPNCLSDETCGNAVVDPSEGCDDGNFNPGDGCDRECRVEAGCGNGVLDIGEQCDDGNVLGGDGCGPTCRRELFDIIDSDGDTISDFDEGNGAVDSDGDGFPDVEDTDSDGDGILDSIEAGDDDMATEPVDTDSDGLSDFRDTDADGDGIPDATEGSVDWDGDGFGNFADPDSDGDYVPDGTEGLTDSDGDATPDYLDVDSDNDTIADRDELFADSDGDAIPNRLDVDSDNDTRLDAIEAGDNDLETFPIDTDADGKPDYIDTDTDDDGLPDRDELGCPGASNPLTPDSDGDGFSDLAEQLLGSDACSPTSAEEFREFTDFFFVLPPGGPPEEAPLEFSSDILRADVHINIDSSGSMDGEIGNLRDRMSSLIVPGIDAEVDDVGFGFSDYRDCSGYAFRLRQRITTDITAVQTAINGLSDTAGGSEPGYSALWHIGTGESAGSCLDLPTFDPASSAIPGVADGDIGGVGFRDDAFPVVIHVTDEAAEDADCGSCARSRTNAVDSLNAIDARMIGVVSGSAPRVQLRDIARRTGAVVPTCAWDGARPSGCGATQCCTGIDGAGQAMESGSCPLVFDISASGSGLASSIVTGLVALVNTTALDITTTLRQDDDEFLRTGIDTRCFIRSIIPASATGSGSCSTTPEIADLDPVDGVMDSFTNVTPGTALFFDVTAANDGCVAPSDTARAFFAFIDVIGDGVTTLDTQSVTIIVPVVDDNPVTVP